MKTKEKQFWEKLIIVDIPARVKGKKVLFKAVRNDIPLSKKVLAYYKSHITNKKFGMEYVPIENMKKELIRPLLSAWMRREVKMTISNKGGVDAFRAMLSHEIEQIQKEREQSLKKVVAWKKLDKRERRRLEMVKIENWEIYTNPDMDEPKLGFRLHGNVYNHKRFRDGDSVITSSIVDFYDRVVVTESGSVYLLGKRKVYPIVEQLSFPFMRK